MRRWALDGGALLAGLAVAWAWPTPGTTDTEPRSDAPALGPTECPPARAADVVSPEQLAELRTTLDERRAWFARRWGEPMARPAEVPALFTEDALRTSLEALPGRVWSTVDCATWPCTGLVLVDGDVLPDDVLAELAMPHAGVSVGEVRNDDRTFDLVEIRFLDAPPANEAQALWTRAISARTRQQHDADIHAVLEGAELADP